MAHRVVQNVGDFLCFVESNFCDWERQFFVQEIHFAIYNWNDNTIGNQRNIVCFSIIEIQPESGSNIFFCYGWLLWYKM